MKPMIVILEPIEFFRYTDTLQVGYHFCLAYRYSDSSLFLSLFFYE